MNKKLAGQILSKYKRAKSYAAMFRRIDNQSWYFNIGISDYGKALVEQARSVLKVVREKEKGK